MQGRWLEEDGAGPLPHPATHRIIALGGRVGERAGAAESDILSGRRLAAGSVRPRAPPARPPRRPGARSEEHTSELQSLMRISYAVFCLKKKKNKNKSKERIPKPYNHKHKRLASTTKPR